MKHLKETLLFNSTLEPISLLEVFQATTDSIRSLIDSSKTTFEADFTEVKCILGNSFYLHSIFLNLITNSIKYARPGIPTVIRIKSTKTGNTSRLVFSDNGIGFDLVKNGGKIFHLNQIFTNQSDSNGIGLYLVKTYMTSVGGTIDVSSEINAGSTFCLTFKPQDL